MDTLLDYFEGFLSDDIEDDVEKHLWSCDSCAELGQRIYALDHTWQGWTAAAHGKLHLRVTLMRALVKAEKETTNVAWRGRLQRWRKTWAGTAEAALRTVLQAPAQASRIIADGVEELARPGSNWAFSAEPSFAGTLGDDDDDRDTAVLATQPLTPDAPRALVELKAGEKSSIVVRIDNLPLGSNPPLVVLVAVKADREVVVQVAEVTSRPGTNSFVARFNQVPPGEYIVAFEPLSNGVGSGP
jgi:hypothetical protein